MYGRAMLVRVMMSTIPPVWCRRCLRSLIMPCRGCLPLHGSERSDMMAGFDAGSGT